MCAVHRDAGGYRTANQWSHDVALWLRSSGAFEDPGQSGTGGHSLRIELAVPHWVRASSAKRLDKHALPLLRGHARPEFSGCPTARCELAQRRLGVKVILSR